MAKTARLTGNIQGHAGQALTWTIYSDHGSVLTSPEEVKATLADGVTFTYDSGDAEQVFAPFMSSTAELNFIVDHDDEIAALVEMARGGEADTYLVVEQDSGWRWIGNLLPEDTEVEIVDGHTEIGLTFTDGLSLLKGMDFVVDSNDIFIRADETAGEPYQPGRTALGLVWVLLNKIPWMQEVSWPAGTVAIREAAGIGTDTTGLYRPNLPYMGINPSAFAKEKKQPRRGRSMPKPKGFVNCYDVLGDILETTGCRIAWDGEGWAVRSPLIADDFSTGVLQYEFTHADLLANGRGAIDGALGFAPWTFDLDPSYAMQTGATRRFTQKFSGARAIHTEAGSNQLFNKFDDVKYVSADRLENKSNLKDSDPLVEFEAESDITLRTQGYFDLKGGIDAKNASGHKPCAVIKLKLGTTSHSSDPYLLSSEMLIQGYDTTITGPAAASSMRPWANATLPDAEWIRESEKGADAFDAPGILYIPLTWEGESFNPNAPSIDQGADGIFYGGLHTALKSGETNVLKYDKWGQLHFDVTLPTIVTPGVSLEGYEIEFGLAFFGAGEFPVNSNKSPEILNTVTGATTGAGTAEEELFEEYIEKFVFHKGRLFKGDGTGDADRIYFEETPNGSVDSFEFADVRIASGTQAGLPAVGPKFINRNKNLWSAGTEDWGFDIGWIPYSGSVTSHSASQENLEVLADEWLRNNASGVEVISADFAPTYEAYSGMPTGAELFSTKCATPGTFDTYYLPTRMTWSSISGISLEAVELLRDSTATVVPGLRNEEEEPDNVKPFVKAINDGLAGKNKSTADTQDEVVTARTKGATTFASLDERLSSFDLTDMSDVSSNVSTATTGQTLVHDGAEFDVRRLKLEDLAEAQSAFDNALLQYNSTSGDWEMQSPQSALGSAVALFDLSDVDGAALPGLNKLLVGDGNKWITIDRSSLQGASEIGLMNDVTIPSAGSRTSGSLLTWNGSTNYEETTAEDFRRETQIGDLAGFEFAGSPGSGDTIEWDGSEWTFTANGSGGGGGASVLDDLTDVDTSGVVAYGMLMRNQDNDAWIDVTTSTVAGRIDLEELANITGTPTSGKILKYDGFDWAVSDESQPTLDEVLASGNTSTAELTTDKHTVTDGTNTITIEPNVTGKAEVTIENAGTGASTFELISGGNVFVTGSPGASGTFNFNKKDHLGDYRSMLRAENSTNVTALVNRSANGTTEIRANNSSAGVAGEVVVAQAHATNGLTIMGAYTMPTADGADGFDFYDGSEKSSLGTSGLWNQYKKMSHRLEAGTYDLTTLVDVSVSTSTNGASHDSQYAGEDVEVYLYKVKRNGAGGNVTLTQVGTTAFNTQHSSDTAVGTETTLTDTGVTMDGEERLMVVLKGTVNISSNRYVHWAYDIHAEKTA
jgi:hypothetical protein